ncbi:antitoxin [Cellulomonas sp. WB94]|uniref:antitoxin n=1 Tax=Cellulomonas sp. WB94 TaxID=2173174 RepID=UPI000D566A75|nr:antitoxin [Cellulomonas sp. WB94]PVU82851.1 antitoxin [Cellulomonas sp. WB94]
MGLDDLVSKGRHALEGHEQQASDALDKAADAIKSRTGDDQDQVVDQVVGKAKEFLAEDKPTE